MSRAPTGEEREKFEKFLFEMDDVLKAFLREASTAGWDLDFSVESLDGLEKLIDHQLDREGANPVLVKNRAGRYLGEVFRRRIGGRWELCLKDPKYLYFGMPVIAGYSKKGIEFSPLTVVGNYAARRKPALLRTAVAAHEEWKS